MPTPTAFFQGEFVPLEEAKIGVMTHAFNYGTAVFEGIRCYKTKKGAAAFRLEPHIKRLYNSGLPINCKQPLETYQYAELW